RSARGSSPSPDGGREPARARLPSRRREGGLVARAAAVVRKVLLELVDDDPTARARRGSRRSRISTSTSTALFHHRLQFVSIAKGHAASGEDAWRVRVADRTAQRMLCLDVWLKTDVVGTSSHTDAGYCA